VTAQAPASTRSPPTATGTLSALLQLTDGRFPTGGHAHSSGFEAAAQNEGVNDVDGLAAFLQGRLHTTGRIMAVFTAAACHGFHRWAERGGAAGQAELPAFIDTLDAEYEARTPSPVLRTVSRRLGRQIIRAGRKVWPHPLLEALASRPGEGLHQPIGFGAVAAASGQEPVNAALASAQENVCGPAMASIRLLGLDPFKVNALIARMAGEIQAVASEAAALADTDAAEFPSQAGYLLDISAEFHATWEVRLFAS
jgi:urease accessory protein